MAKSKMEDFLLLLNIKFYTVIISLEKRHIQESEQTAKPSKYLKNLTSTCKTCQLKVTKREVVKTDRHTNNIDSDCQDRQCVFTQDPSCRFDCQLREV